MSTHRRPAGTPSGGQFAPKQNSDPEVRLADLFATEEKRAASAANPRLRDPSLRDALVRDQSALVRATFARRSDLGTDEVETLCDDSSPLVRMLLAGNRSANPDALAPLVADPEPQVRMRMARRHDLMSGQYQMLVGDSDAQVSAVAREALLERYP